MTESTSHDFDSLFDSYDDEQASQEATSRMLNPEQCDSLSRKQWRDALNAAAVIDGPDGDEIRKLVESNYTTDWDTESFGHYTRLDPETHPVEYPEHGTKAVPSSSIPTGYLGISFADQMGLHFLQFVGDLKAWKKGFDSEAYADHVKRCRTARVHGMLGLENAGNGQIRRKQASHKRKAETDSDKAAKAARIAAKLAKLDAKYKK